MRAVVIRRLLLLPHVGLGITIMIFGLLQMLSPELRATLGDAFREILDPRLSGPP